MSNKEHSSRSDLGSKYGNARRIMPKNAPKIQYSISGLIFISQPNFTSGSNSLARLRKWARMQWKPHRSHQWVVHLRPKRFRNPRFHRIESLLCDFCSSTLIALALQIVPKFSSLIQGSSKAHLSFLLAPLIQSLTALPRAYSVADTSSRKDLFDEAIQYETQIQRYDPLQQTQSCRRFEW